MGCRRAFVAEAPLVLPHMASTPENLRNVRQAGGTALRTKIECGSSHTLVSQRAVLA